MSTLAKIRKRWDERLHPRDPVGRFRDKFPFDLDYGIRDNGTRSALTSTEIALSVDEQVKRLRVLQAEASVSGDYARAAQIAQEINSLHDKTSYAKWIRRRRQFGRFARSSKTIGCPVDSESK